MGRCGQVLHRFGAFGDEPEEFGPGPGIVLLEEPGHAVGDPGSGFKIAELLFDIGADPFRAGRRHLRVRLGEKAPQFGEDFRRIAFGEKGLIGGKFPHLAPGRQQMAPAGLALGEDAELLAAVKKPVELLHFRSRRAEKPRAVFVEKLFTFGLRAVPRLAVDVISGAFQSGQIPAAAAVEPFDAHLFEAAHLFGQEGRVAVFRGVAFGLIVSPVVDVDVEAAGDLNVLPLIEMRLIVAGQLHRHVGGEFLRQLGRVEVGPVADDEEFFTGAVLGEASGELQMELPEPFPRGLAARQG